MRFVLVASLVACITALNPGRRELMLKFAAGGAAAAAAPAMATYTGPSHN